MTKNMEYLYNIIYADINSHFSDELPTISDIDAKAETLRELLSTTYPVSDIEFFQLKHKLISEILHKIEGEPITLRGHDTEHQSWYYLEENDGFYWNRYKKYLRSIKHWSLDIVNNLDQTTDEIMDELGNPKDKRRTFQRRGLLLGDVQSGKTATYTAICNKAADAGYRIIIVLAGMMENLRFQTQERLDDEFTGIESRFALDKKAEQEIRNRPVGVGKLPPIRADKRIARFTSVATDFNKRTLRAVGLSLRNFNGTALFVVKKNKSILNHLCTWLKDNNSDYDNGLIDLPLLLIDDEADNASVNTNSEEKNPTAINQAIRNILNCFRQASYLGITATPFANIFIDPDVDDGTKDLFPKDFLTVLPIPERYIGADKIFGNGNADDWAIENENRSYYRKEGEYGQAIIPILNEEQASFFYFKHKKELANDLYDLPISLREAIRYFILVCGISDLRNDNTEHRSMLVNVSRFTNVQNRVAELIKKYLNPIKADLKNYSKLNIDKAMQIERIALLFETWEKFKLQNLARIDWEKFLPVFLNKTAQRIEVRSVNQQHGASSLNYYEYKNVGMRVIAVGGNSLSRGLTLEGLCVSYFYRNSMMYDTLLQMGRWFGYRPNYDDLFKVWMAEDAIDWYGYITDAVNELKEELQKMKRQNQTPEEFGLKVRQAPGSLLITARNKMRTATSVSRPITVSGRMIETPRLKADHQSITENEKICRSFLQAISQKSIVEFDDTTKAFIWRNIPKRSVIDLIGEFSSHPWNLNFQKVALSEYIANDDNKLELWDVAIPQGTSESVVTVELSGSELKVKPEIRAIEVDGTIKNMLRVSGHHVRVGTGGCSKIGLSQEKIKEIRAKGGKITDSSYLIADRKPILLIHILKKKSKVEDTTDNIPDILFALGLGFPFDGEAKTANYMVNINELKNWVDIEDEDDDEINS